MKIIPLTKGKLEEAIQVVLRAKLDTREEIEHHLSQIEAQLIATVEENVVGVIGWYQDNVSYASEAMGVDFPGEKAYWVGFFAVDKEYQGQGIGGKLLEQLEEVVKEKGAGELWVSSVPETKTYYEEHGFRLIKEGEIDGNKKYFMLKDIK